MNAEHDVRSMRAWLNAIYPNMPILLQRNDQNTPKPYFYLEDVSESFRDNGFGYHDYQRMIRIHLIMEGSRTPNAQTEVYWKIKRVLQYLKEALIQSRVVPSYLFNFGYFPPVFYEKSTDPITAGTYTFAISMIDFEGIESLPSQDVTIVADGSKGYFLSVTNWPQQNPIACSYVLYRRPSPSAALVGVQEIPVNFTSGDSTSVVLAQPTLLSPAKAPVAASKIRFGYLKVVDANATMMESQNVDDAFHGWVMVQVVSHVPHARTAVPALDHLTNTITLTV